MAMQTRREFLETSMFAAAAAASSTQLSGLVQAAEQSTSPNERLRVAVLGVNGRGASHLAGFGNRKDCEIVAICDPDEEVGRTKGVEKIEKQTGKKPAYYADVRKLLEDKSIDIISIATPNHWHSLAAIWGIQAGKDVYVEKPVSHNVSEGRRIVEAARKHKKIVQTGTQSRSATGVRDLIEYVKAGKIGEVTLARALCYKPRPSIGPKGTYDVPAKVNYDVWCGPAPLHQPTRPRFHYDWHWQWDYGNGDLGNQGIHQMDIARWGLGVDDLGQAVFSYGGRFGYEDAGETANTQVSVHDYGNKTLVFEVRGLKTPAYKDAMVGVIFYGPDGYVVNNGSGGAAFDKSGKKVKDFGGGGEQSHFDNFVNAVRSRKHEELHADVLEGHLSSALCHLGNISYRLGEVVSPIEAKERVAASKTKDECLETFERFSHHLAENKVDMEKLHIQYGANLAVDGKVETFTGPLSDKANPMLSRDYRKGFVVPAAGQA